MVLNKDQIKATIKKEKEGSKQTFKDETDILLDRAVDLYQKKEVSNEVFKALVANILMNATQQTMTDLRKDLVKRTLRMSGEDTNKIFLLNYSKKSYA